MKIKDKIIDDKKIELILKENLGLSECNVKEFNRIGGMTNTNYKVKFNDETVILRLPGIGTDKMIDRSNEFRNIKLLSNSGINAEIFYINEETGVKISKYIEGAETLTIDRAKEKENMKLVASLIKKLHTSNIEMKNKFDAFNELDKYEKIISGNGYKLYENYEEIRDKVVEIKKYMKKYGETYVPSHNDTLPDNFVKDSNGRLYLIDWEYSGMNDNLWDLAAYSIETGLTEKEEEKFLGYYFEREYTKKDKVRLLMNKIIQDILWALWTIIKENEGEDYGSYGRDRYNRGVSNLKKLYKILNEEKLIYDK